MQPPVAVPATSGKKERKRFLAKVPGEQSVMFIGEQPGNEEDLTGKPFVGPAGRLFDNALEAAGIDRKQTYVTNVVKHFKWEPRGKRRIHKKPNSMEIAACRPWLETEIALVKPDVIVALGATAAQVSSRTAIPSDKTTRRIYSFNPCTLCHGHSSPLINSSCSG